MAGSSARMVLDFVVQGEIGAGVSAPMALSWSYSAARAFGRADPGRPANASRVPATDTLESRNSLAAYRDTGRIGEARKLNP